MAFSGSPQLNGYDALEVIPTARAMDDILHLHNHIRLKQACPDLARAFRP